MTSTPWQPHLGPLLVALLLVMSGPQAGSLAVAQSGKFQAQPASSPSQRSPLYPTEASRSRQPNLQPSLELPARTPPPATAQESAPTTGRRSTIDVEYCTVRFIDEIHLPALEAGAIQSIFVEEGQAIDAGMVVGQIDDELLKMELAQAELRYNNARDAANDDTSIQAAAKEYDLTRVEAAKTRRLAAKGSKSESEVLEAEFREQIALLKRKKAEKDREQAMGDARVEYARMQQVEARLKRHTLTSNYDAYVVEILKKPQEFVNVGEDVMRLGRMDQLWVQGNVNVDQLSENDALNRPVTITYPLAGGKTATFEGRIDQVSLERQTGEQYAIKVRVDNQRVGDGWLLRPYARASLVIHLDRE